MAKEYSRTLRIGKLMQRELAQLIQTEIKDPRVGMVTVSDVEVTTDLSHAKIYITVLGKEDSKESLDVLNRAAGFLKRELSRRLVMRAMPTLNFIYDNTLDTANRVSELINSSPKPDTNKDR